MPTLANLVVRITGDTGQLVGSLNKAESRAGRFKDRMSQVGAVARRSGLALTAYGAAGTAALGALVKSSQDQAIGISRLDQSLKNVGQSYERQRVAIEKIIEAQQRKTNFGDEEQREALQKLITIGGQYEGSLQALTIAQDVAAGSSISLESAALLVGKAIAGETSSLSRYGIMLEKGASQTEIMAALTKQFGGAAEAAANPVTQMKNRLGDLGQVVGGALLPFVNKMAVAIEGFTRTLTNLNPRVLQIGAVVVGATVAFAALAGPILLAASAFGLLLSPVGLVVAAIAGLVVAGVLLAKNWDKVRAFVGRIWESIAKRLQPVINFMIGAWDTFKGALGKVVEAAETMANLVIGAFDVFANAIEVPINAAIKAINLLISGLNLVARTSIEPISEIDINVREAADSMLSSVGDFASESLEKVTGFVGGAKDAIGDFATGSIDSLTNFGNEAATQLQQVGGEFEALGQKAGEAGEQMFIRTRAGFDKAAQEMADNIVKQKLDVQMLGDAYMEFGDMFEGMSVEQRAQMILTQEENTRMRENAERNAEYMAVAAEKMAARIAEANRLAFGGGIERSASATLNSPLAKNSQHALFSQWMAAAAAGGDVAGWNRVQGQYVHPGGSPATPFTFDDRAMDAVFKAWEEAGRPANAGMTNNEFLQWKEKNEEGKIVTVNVSLNLDGTEIGDSLGNAASTNESMRDQ